jgi:hypothetical protein
MEYTFEHLREDIQSLGQVTSGWRDYKPRALWPQVQVDGSEQLVSLDPNSPEAAAYDYFLHKYGQAAGPGIAARFFAIHNFVVTNLHRLERRGLLKPQPGGPTTAEDLLRFLLTCFEDTPGRNHLPRSIYDGESGLHLPYQDIMADFHRLRALRRRLKSVEC